MLLVTGAAGKTGQAVIRALAERGASVRALARRPEQAAPLQALGAREVIIGDLCDPAALRSAMQGVRAVYHICPNVHPDEVGIGRSAIAAAQAAGVERFVYHSVLHPHTEAMPHHWHKLRVEEALLASGLPFTVLRPTAYMQNTLAQWQAITTRGVYAVPYPVESRLSLVDVRDVGEAAAAVLLDDSHAFAAYDLAGTPPLSQAEVAQAYAAALGRPVRAEALPVDEWERGARAAGLGDYAVATLRAMFAYYAAHGLPGNPRVLTWLLGRPPTSLADFIARAASERA